MAFEYNPPKSENARLIPDKVPEAPVTIQVEGSTGEEGNLPAPETPPIEGTIQTPEGTEAPLTPTPEGVVTPPTPPVPAKTPEQIASDAAAEDELEEKALKKALQKLGLTSIDELNERLAPAPATETPEQKAEREENEEVSVIAYGVKNKIFTTDDVSTLKTLKKQPLADVAFNDFSKTYKAQYVGRLNEDDSPYPVTDLEVQEAFNDFYHLDSDNKLVKEKGTALVESRGKEILSSLETKYSQAVDDVKYIAERDTFMQKEFKPFMKEALASIPKEIIFGEGDNKVVIQTEPFDKKEIEKLFAVDSVFDNLFDNKNSQKAKDAIKEQMKNQIIAKNINTIIETARSVGHGQGLKEGKIGAVAPFTPEAPKGNNGVSAVPGQLSEPAKARLKNTYATGTRN